MNWYIPWSGPRPGRGVPAWLNEGLAQELEGASVKGNQRLASVAYAKSLAATEFLVRRHGMHELERLLDLLAEGQPIEAALNSVYRLDYRALDRAVGKWLRSMQ